MGTLAEVRKNYLRNQESTFHGTFTFSASYLAGGEAVAIPLNEINLVLFPHQGAYTYEYVPATGKIKALRANPTTGVFEEPVDTTDLSAAGAIPFVAFGK